MSPSSPLSLPCRWLWPLCVLMLCSPFLACEEPDEEVDPGEPIERDLSAILDNDTLNVLITYNTTSYFLYRGEPMGFEYELLKAFAEEHDVPMKTRVVENEKRDSLFYYLNQGEGDIAAAQLVPQAVDRAGVAFSRSLYRTYPTLVQTDEPLPEADLPGAAARALEQEEESLEESLPDSVEIQARLVRRPAELSGEEVHVPSSSAYADMLVELSDSLSEDITVVEVKGDVSYESLIRQVSSGDIELTVSPANVAKLKESYFTNVVVQPRVGPKHDVAWGLRKNAPELQAALDEWIADEKYGALFNTLYKKYFIDRRGYHERLESEYLSSETGRLSDYDELLQEGAQQIGWDWRLLASQCFQESRFNPAARSWAGATGLLQLMPPTAREFGVSNMLDPEENVEGAVKFIRWLTDYWDDQIEDPSERMKFILASYNTGHGHVEDARRLTRKHGDNPNRWEDVSYWLLKKSEKQYYTDPVVKYGYARGLEPVTYVAVILERFDHYRQLVVDQGEGLAAETAPAATVPNRR